MVKYIQIRNITDARDVIQAAAILVGKILNLKEPNRKIEKEPFWKRRIDDDIKRLRKDLSRIDAWFKGKWRNCKKNEKEALNKKYKLRLKGFNMVMEELKQRIIAKAAKVKIYLHRIRQFRDNFHLTKVDSLRI